MRFDRVGDWAQSGTREALRLSCMSNTAQVRSEHMELRKTLNILLQNVKGEPLL